VSEPVNQETWAPSGQPFLLANNLSGDGQVGCEPMAESRNSSSRCESYELVCVQQQHWSVLRPVLREHCSVLSSAAMSVIQTAMFVAFDMHGHGPRGIKISCCWKGLSAIVSQDTVASATS